MRGQPVTLNTLHDVDPTGLTDGQAPVWNATAKKYKPGSTGASALPCTQQSASYTLVLADIYTCVEFTGSSAENCTIPPHSSVAYPVGGWIEVRQFGTGQVTFVAGSGVTLRSPNSAVKTCSQYTTCVLHQRATDDWVLVGDLV